MRITRNHIDKCLEVFFDEQLEYNNNSFSLDPHGRALAHSWLILLSNFFEKEARNTLAKTLQEWKS